MKCDFDQELVRLYADGVLKGGNVRHIEEHVSQCEQCRQELTSIHTIGRVISALPRERASDELISSILARVEVGGHGSIWDTVGETARIMWSVAMNGFKIEDNREGPLRRRLPEWVVRWVLFV